MNNNKIFGKCLAFNSNVTSFDDIELVNKINSVSELDEVLKETPSIFYIINKTNNFVLVLSHFKVYLTKKDVIDEYKKTKYIYYMNTDDIINSKENFKNKIRLSYGTGSSPTTIEQYVPHNYLETLIDKQNINFDTKSNKEFVQQLVLLRIEGLFSKLFLENAVYKYHTNDPINKFKFTNIYYMDDNNNKRIVYKDFFLDKEYNETIFPNKTYFDPSFKTDYFSTNCSDYADKEYGTMINLNSVKFTIRNKHVMIETDELSDFRLSIEQRSQIILSSGETYTAFDFYPMFDKDNIRPRLVNLLKTSFTKTYNRIKRNFDTKTKNYQNLELYFFRVSKGKKSSDNLKLFNLKFKDFSKIELYDSKTDKDITQKICSLLLDKKSNWEYIIDQSYDTKTYNYINTAIPNDKKCSIKFDQSATYNASVNVFVKLIKGGHSISFKNPEESCFETFAHAGLITNEEAEVYKCQYLLLKM